MKRDADVSSKTFTQVLSCSLPPLYIFFRIFLQHINDMKHYLFGHLCKTSSEVFDGQDVSI
jgi:hypothetical protein